MTPPRYESAEVLSRFSAGEYNQVYEIAMHFAHAGVADAQCMLGVLYQLGLGVSQDGPKAVLWYQKAARQGHALALNNLGTIYLHGMPGVSADRKTALEFYMQAHAAGFDAMDLAELRRTDNG